MDKTKIEDYPTTAQQRIKNSLIKELSDEIRQLEKERESLFKEKEEAKLKALMIALAEPDPADPSIPVTLSNLIHNTIVRPYIEKSNDANHKYEERSKEIEDKLDALKLAKKGLESKKSFVSTEDSKHVDIKNIFKPPLDK